MLVLLDGLAAEHVGPAAARMGWPAPLDPARGAPWQHRLPPSTSAVATLATWLTGLAPDAHGLLSVRDSGAERLAPHVPTLAQNLSARGGRAFAALAAPQFGDDICGLGRGFEVWDAPAISQQRAADPLVAGLVERSAAARASGGELLVVVAFQRDSEPPAAALVPHLRVRLEGTQAKLVWGPKLSAPGGGAEAAVEFAETFARRRSSPEAEILEAARRDAAVAAQIAALSALLAALETPPAHLIVVGLPAPGWPAVAGEPFSPGAWSVPHLALEGGVPGMDASAVQLARALIGPRPPLAERTFGATVGLSWAREGHVARTHRLLPGGLAFVSETFGGEDARPDVPPPGDALCIECAPDAPRVEWMLLGPSGDLLGQPAGAPLPVRLEPGAKLLVPVLRRGAAVQLVRPADCAAPLWLGETLAPGPQPARQPLDLGPFGGHFDDLFSPAAPPPPGSLRITRVGAAPGRLEQGPLDAAGAEALAAARRYLASLPAGQ
ncbi:MAG: hypothetical protein GC161_01820 [Planctomycetaceae bacterium]|nr:hypothetical protein [Planctomycetaceae bacterium]